MNDDNIIPIGRETLRQRADRILGPSLRSRAAALAASSDAVTRQARTRSVPSNDNGGRR